MNSLSDVKINLKQYYIYVEFHFFRVQNNFLILSVTSVLKEIKVCERFQYNLFLA